MLAHKIACIELSCCRYKLKPSYCYRCDGVIGPTGHGLRCTRCSLVFHKRCLEDRLSTVCPQVIHHFGVQVHMLASALIKYVINMSALLPLTHEISTKSRLLLNSALSLETSRSYAQVAVSDPIPYIEQVTKGSILLEPRILQAKYKELLPALGYGEQPHSFRPKLYKLDSACTACRGVLKV